MKSFYRLALLTILTIISFNSVALAQIEIPKKPSKEMAVYDGADIFKENEEPINDFYPMSSTS